MQPSQPGVLLYHYNVEPIPIAMHFLSEKLRSLKIQTRLVVFYTIFALITVGVVIYFSYNQAAKSIQRTIENELGVITGLKMDNLDCWVDQQRQMAIFLAELPELHSLSGQLLDVNADQKEPRIQIGQQGVDDGRPIFYVRDNGMGIAPEHFDRVVGLFNKLDPRTDGTAIGLALVKRIIEVHGGRIWVESELEKGTTFFFAPLQEDRGSHG